MNINYLKIFFLISLITFLSVNDSKAQAMKNSGPRFGLTVVGPGLLADILNGEREIGDIVNLWHSTFLDLLLSDIGEVETSSGDPIFYQAAVPFPFFRVGETLQ